VLLAQLMRGYIKRRQWLARLQAIEIGRLLFGQPEPKMVSSDELLAMLPQA
jgi:hypothetical protein